MSNIRHHTQSNYGKYKEVFFCCNFILLIFIIALTSCSRGLNTSENNNIIKLTGTSTLLIGKNVQVMQDEEKLLTPATAIRSRNFLQSNSNVPDYYSPKGYLWIKFRVANLTTDSNFVLDINYPLLDQVTLYQFDSNRAENQQNEGFADTFSVKKYKVQSLIFNLNIPSHDTPTYLLKVYSNVPVILPLQIGTIENLMAAEEHKDILTALYAGIIIALFLYNIFIYFSIKDKSYLYYLIHILFFALTQLFLQGYGERLFWPNKPWLNSYSIIISAVIAGISGISFAKRFLHTKKIMPLANKIFNLFILLYLVAAILVFAGLYRYSFRLIDGTVSALVIFAFIISAIIAKKGSSDAVFFLISYSVFIVAMLVFVGKNVGLLPYNNFSNYILYAASSIQAVLLSIALANRINIYKKEKEKLLIEINTHQQTLINKIVVALEDERKRIAEDLHDDVGGTLSALAMHISNLPSDLQQSKDIENYYKHTLQLSNRAVNDIRSIAHNLLPKDFKTTGLFKMLDKKIEELNTVTPIKFNLIAEGEEKRLNEVTVVTIYRIVNELLTNIIKHSLAKEATIQLFIEPGHVQIMAEDDGIGFNNDVPGKGIGLKNITGRVEFLKGEINIDSSNNGTQTIINIPI